MPHIPFCHPVASGQELQYIQQVITTAHLSGDGPFTKKCHALLEEQLGVPKVLLTSSCTHALEMTALLLNIKEGDEVIIPSFTFVSTVNAFILRGAHPIFADIRPDTLNIDETQLKYLITSRTKAIVVVHYAGVGCEMDTIMTIAKQHRIAIVEDNAHGLFGKYRGQYLGTFGSMATQSFHETKNFTCGEGGALVINDPELIERAEMIREKGTNRSRFFRGQVDKYTWVDLGSSYLPSEILAAFLYAQLEARYQIQEKRQQLWNCYRQQLQDWAHSHNIGLPVIPPQCEHPAHLFYLIMSSFKQRQEFIAHLVARKIYAVFHYLPLHISPMGQRYGGHIGDCPIAEDVSERLVRLPLYNDMTETEQQFVLKSIYEFHSS